MRREDTNRSLHRSTAIAAGMLMTLWLPGDGGAADPYQPARDRLVDIHVAPAGVSDRRVLDAIRTTPRHRFVPTSQRSRAYYDMALPIGQSQTISSPFIVAAMTESLEPRETDRVLEIGTGSGYQAAVLSPLVADVYTIEIVRELGERAADVLARLKYENVHVRVGDGFAGWPEAAPFDKIIVTCSPESVPKPLVDQLREGGMMVIPVGERYQQTLYRMIKTDGELVRQPLRPTLFVPMTGTAEDRRQLLPDASNPGLINPDFDDADDDPTIVPGWYYGRQVTRTSEDGRTFIRFRNETPDLGAHLLQGLAIDPAFSPILKLDATVRTGGVVAGSSRDMLPLVSVTFYDADRAEVGGAMLGPFRGTRDWRNVSRLVQVPPTAREAIVRAGLFGATGTADFDRVQLEPRD